MLASSGGVKNGNNGFIGIKTTILKGVHIGNNVIISTNSLVNKDNPNNCFAAGNPVKVIMPIEEYYQKRKQTQLEEATKLVKEYCAVFGKDPDEEALCEFFWLFKNDRSELTKCWEKKMQLVGNYEFSKKKLKENQKEFDDMNDFITKVSDKIVCDK